MRLTRLARKAAANPRLAIRRAVAEVRATIERRTAPRRSRGLDAPRLTHMLGARSIDDLYQRLLARPSPTPTPSAGEFAQLTEDDRQWILRAAEAALARRVDLLGSGQVELPIPTDWLRDFTSGRRWSPQWARSIDYVFADDSDVKIVWELSRLQWLLPAGQAFVLTGDERYAQGVREIVEEWLEANPCAMTVNWSVAMEPAMRVLALVWLFHACGRSIAWSDERFRVAFIRGLFLHVDFVDRNIEWSDPRGNHYTADLAALTVGGLFFGEGEKPTRWASRGWDELQREIDLQVHPDGVDFEASTAYHRLVAELFLLPAFYRLRLGYDVPVRYRQRLEAMGRFTMAYSRPDGSSPAWGDDDDARALPLGGFAIRDHRYLPGLIGGSLGIDDLCFDLGAPRTEALWVVGADASRALRPGAPPLDGATEFESGGVVVLRSRDDYVFIDCGPVGLAGRGGHGHNDCLSFEATLNGVALVVDCGTYVYTRSAEWRNRFRGTHVHNTPMIDGVEQARIATDSLWRIEPDADGEIVEAATTEDVLRFRGRHRGYQRLASPVIVERTIELDRKRSHLMIRDDFVGSGSHDISIPLQLAVGTTVNAYDGSVDATSQGRRFRITWEVGNDWVCDVGSGWVSPSYGVKIEAPRIEWRRSGPLTALTIVIEAVGP